MTTGIRLPASAVLAVLVLAVGALVFRGSGDDDATSSTATTAVPPTVGGDDPAAGSAAGSAVGSAPSEAAAGLAPPGTYRYRVERRPSGGPPQAYESTLVVTGSGSTRTEDRDHLGTHVRRHFTLHGAARTETAMVLVNGPYEGRCDWTPALPTLHTPLETGRTWKAEASCRLPVVDDVVDVAVHEDARVVATETVTVAGTSLETVRIERSARLTSTVDGRRTTRTTKRTEWFSPWRGLVVRAVERVTEAGDGPDRTYEQIEELVL